MESTNMGRFPIKNWGLKTIYPSQTHPIWAGRFLFFWLRILTAVAKRVEALSMSSPERAGGFLVLMGVAGSLPDELRDAG